MIQLFSSCGIIENISGGDVSMSNLIQLWFYIFAAVVLITFIVSELTRNYSQVDKIWSLLPIVYSWVTVAAFPSHRLYIMAFLVTVWGLRLSYNFSRKGGYNIIPWKGEEDYRWRVMRDVPALKGRFRFGLFNLLFISLYQNVLILLFSTPLLLAAMNQGKQLSVIDLLAALSLFSFIYIESVADSQLYRYQMEKRRAEKGEIPYTESLSKGFMTSGLWRLVRHPNFAAEQAIWICFYFFGVAASGKWVNLTITGPLLLILLFIGSSQLTEGISSKKYPEYSDYQKRVPKFIPRLFGFKKNR